jgi:sec-independent protein translocase protein TatC
VVFHFITSVAPEGVAVMTDIGKYLDFVLTLFLAFGITFEVPVAVILLVRMGVVSIEKLKEARPYVIVGAFVIGAIFTPPDVVSQIMLAVPLCLLYEAGIWLARFVSRPAEASDYQPLTEAEMEQELDAIEQKSERKRIESG